MDVRDALMGQYHAAMDMLRQAIELCPAEHWDCDTHAVPFWRVVYHTLYGTHMYLQQNLESFRPWALHKEDYNDLPWPPGSEPKIDDPYSREQMLDYWRICDGMIDSCVDRLDLDAAGSGFPWHQHMPKLDHQLQNLRHIQHHAALLAGRLRQANGAEVRWIRSVKGGKADFYGA